MNEITTQKALNFPAQNITHDLGKASLLLIPSGKDKEQLHQAMQRLLAQKCICPQDLSHALLLGVVGGMHTSPPDMGLSPVHACRHLL